MGDYVNNKDMVSKALAFELDSGLLQAVEKSCSIRDIGDVKMVYCTKGGPGPQVLDASSEVFEFKVE
eukprot:scaffold858_cov94-Skeletonema_dohrnii-CCMP3373.AAC.1